VFRTTLKPAPYQPNAGQSFVIRRKGVVESTIGTCASCHSQRQPDGTFLSGAPSLNANLFARVDLPPSLETQRNEMRALFSTPWLNPDPNMELLNPLTREEIDGWRIPPAVTHRIGSSLHYPVRIPSLIGIGDRKYFDASGRHRHRSIGDLMRYAALADISFGIESYQRYGDFIPRGDGFKTLPDPKSLVRFSDAQLYALALYLYSLKPPPNPNRPDSTSAAGERVFRREGCANCHTPPLYTNNKLIPADGFSVPLEHRGKYDILDVRIGLDSYSTLHTRRGSGYYKVPSLKDLWLRPVLEHNGSVTTLEEWFDPRRLNDDFVPTGFKGPRTTRAVKGHRFGLNLTEADKKALIAFLRTL
jgi:mono/diheme cytochrome c family protein